MRITALPHLNCRRRGFGDMLSLDCVPELVPVLESILGLPGEKQLMVGKGRGTGGIG